MSIAAELLQRRIQTLVDDLQQWQRLIADNILWELSPRRGRCVGSGPRHAEAGPPPARIAAPR